MNHFQKSFLLFSSLALTDAAFGASPPGETFTVDSGTIVTVSPDGGYSLKFKTKEWIFAGSVGQSLGGVATHDGSDKIGDYVEVTFAGAKSPQRYAIRAYKAKPIVLFSDTAGGQLLNKTPFPTLSTYPSGLSHLSHNGNFGVPSYSDLGSDSPWIFFDGDANAFVISAASDYLVANTTLTSGGGIQAGVLPSIESLPAGFTHKTILVVEPGINRAYETWGHALTDQEGKVRPANDAYAGLKYFGYWTDRGAGYYYNYEASKGYEGTLLAVRDQFKAMGVNPGYTQLDSWWYPKGLFQQWDFSAVFSGLYTYTASKTLFPDGLASFHQRLGMPLMTHAKWVDSSSPYRSQYKFSDNVAVDAAYWNDRMDYLRESGVMTYEQDWLSDKTRPEWNLTDPNAFTDNMAAAAAARGITLQYCMPLPRYYLQGAKYSNLMTMRVSNDRFEQSKWREFLYDSRLVGALGAWPWSDVYMSTETSNLLLSTLSGGMVGIGDKLDEVNKANLLKAVRTDGVIVKPDAPITPTDATYVAAAGASNAPLVSMTSTDHGQGMRAAYVFAYADGDKGLARFTPASLGFTGRTYVYDYFNDTAKALAAADAFSTTVNSDGSYYVLVPVGASQIALLGDGGKFVTRGKQRFSSVVDDGTLKVTVKFATGEGPVTLKGWARSLPQSTASTGQITNPRFDKDTQGFSFDVSPGPTNEAVVQFSL